MTETAGAAGAAGAEAFGTDAAGAVEIYRAPEGEVVFNVDAAEETIWATEEQIADLFDVDRSVINRHVRNIFRDGELDAEKTSRKRIELRDEGGRQVRRQVRRFNLDMIISIGYRVNSKKATAFRLWATSVLKRYAVQGAAINREKLAALPAEEAKARLSEIEGAMDVVRRLLRSSELSLEETNGVLEVISRYMGSVETISEFADGHFSFSRSGKERSPLTARQLTELVLKMRTDLHETGVFGQVSETSLGIDAADMEDLAEKIYSGIRPEDEVAERAAKILYFIVKRKPFTDGNKRIGALAFILYLTQNDFLLTHGSETKISDRALTALVLLIAESSDQEEKLIRDLIVRLLRD